MATTKKDRIAAQVVNREVVLVDVVQAALMLGTSVGHVRELIRTGRLTHVRIGRFMRVPTSAIHDLIADAMELGRT